MKVIFCLGALTQGGAQRVVVNLSNYFSDKNSEVSIVTTKKDNIFYTINKDVNIISLDDSNKRKNIFVRNIVRIKTLYEIIKKENPDIILSFLPEPTFRVMLVNLFLKKKVIISVRNDPNIIYNSFLKKIIVKLLYNRANGFVFQTNDAQKWFDLKIQNKSTVIPNPLADEFIVQPFNGNREKTIVNVARIANQKRQDLLIEAFSVVQAKHPNYKLKFYGNGDCTLLKKKICDLGIENSVEFMGEVSNIKDELYKAGIFVLCSDYEGMPNALMEAMALGLPCISTDCPCGGPKFLIKSKVNGILFPVGNKDKLIESINYLIENSDKAKIIGKNANKICKILNPQVINMQWDAYINKIIKETKL